MSNCECTADVELDDLDFDVPGGEGIQVGSPAPGFEVTALVGKEFKTLKLSEYRGKWVCLFFYPLDFTFVCPTEIVDFSKRSGEFEKLNCQVIGGSTDSEFSHLGWVSTNPQLKGLKIPLIADYTKEIAYDYGILLEDKGLALRGCFLIDPEGILRFQYVTDLKVGRNIDEVLRVLQALQSDELCPCGWSPGEEFIKT